MKSLGGFENENEPCPWNDAAKKPKRISLVSLCRGAVSLESEVAYAALALALALGPWLPSWLYMDGWMDAAEVSCLLIFFLDRTDARGLSATCGPCWERGVWRVCLSGRRGKTGD